MTAINHTAVLLALRNVALSLASLPADRAWTNIPFTPTPGAAYIEEDYAPSTSTLLSGPSKGGVGEDTGLYVIRWYAVAGQGLAAGSAVDALLALYPKGASIPASDGSVVRVRGDVGPWRSGFTNVPGGWAVATVTIPFRVFTTNPA